METALTGKCLVPLQFLATNCIFGYYSLWLLPWRRGHSPQSVASNITNPATFSWFQLEVGRREDFSCLLTHSFRIINVIAQFFLSMPILSHLPSVLEEGSLGDGPG
jgi:hypothetical protein